MDGEIASVSHTKAIRENCNLQNQVEPKINQFGLSIVLICDSHEHDDLWGESYQCSLSNETSRAFLGSTVSDIY